MENPNYPVNPNAKEMIESLSATLHLVPNKDLEQGADKNISAYGEFNVNGRDLLIRVSDHNTFLYNWIENNDEIDLQMSANYAITFVDKVPFNSSPQKENNVNGETPTIMTVRQYVYYCNKLTPEEAELVISACVQLAVSGVFTDPLEENDERHAIILRHTTNTATKDLTTKIRKDHRKKKAQSTNGEINNQENQQDTNMKTENRKRNVVRLTESQLIHMISESVKKTLNEITTESYVNSRYQHVIEIKEGNYIHVDYKTVISS